MDLLHLICRSHVQSGFPFNEMLVNLTTNYFRHPHAAPYKQSTKTVVIGKIPTPNQSYSLGGPPCVCPRCAKSRLFFTTGSQGSQGPEFCTLQPLLVHQGFLF